MDSTQWDVAIVGAGALGVSCAYELIKAGHSVILFDQYLPPHKQGSSYGETRLFRQAYFEDERYIPFLKEAYQFWKDWEKEFQAKFFHETGYLTFFNSDSDLVNKMKHNAQKWNISGVELNTQDLRQKFPFFTIQNHLKGYLEENAGFLDVENVLTQCQQTFIDLGGKANFQEKVVHWERNHNRYKLLTNKSSYICNKIIFTPGAWLRDLPSLGDLKLTIRRGVQFWANSHQNLPSMPCFAFAIGKEYIFGFPPFKNRGVKIASYYPRGKVANLDVLRTNYTTEEWQDVHSVAHQFFSWLPPEPDEFHVCMYSLTSDEDFILDYLPTTRNILVLGGGSGHAFKFIPFLAKQVSNFFMDGKDIPEYLKFFAINRTKKN